MQLDLGMRSSFASEFPFMATKIKRLYFDITKYDLAEMNSHFFIVSYYLLPRKTIIDLSLEFTRFHVMKLTRNRQREV